MKRILSDGYQEIELSQSDFDFLVGQLKIKELTSLERHMREFVEHFGLAELRSLVKKVSNDREE